MTNGILGIIACPMLEDELAYDLANDPEPKDVYVLESENTDAFRRKLRNRGIAFTDLDEWDFMHTDNMFDRSRFTVVIRMMSLGLHSEPAKLKTTLQDDLVMLQGRVDTVAMYYGMCGNYGWDLTQWAKKNVDFPVEVFRDSQGLVCDDCIGVAVGGIDGYHRLIKKYTGMLYMTPKLATNWVEYYSNSDMAKGADIMGPGDPMENMKKLFKLAGYTHAVQIDTGLEEDKREFDEKSRGVADYLELELVQAEPGMTDLGPTREIYARAKRDLDAVAARS